MSRKKNPRDPREPVKPKCRDCGRVARTMFEQIDGVMTGLCRWHFKKRFGFNRTDSQLEMHQ